MIQIQKEFLTLPIDEVIPYENNPRVNDIKASITAVQDAKTKMEYAVFQAKKKLGQ